ncbi:hypothetical protein, partial [Desulfovulcanus sp.]
MKIISSKILFEGSNGKEEKILLFFLIFFLLFQRTSLAEPGVWTCFQNNWPYELSDISPDPDLVRGRLENGMRYVIKENHEPEKRVALYLDVQAGSLNE